MTTFESAVSEFLLDQHPSVSVIGSAASGKSTLLLKWGREAVKRGWKVFALDADTGALYDEFPAPERMAEHLEGEVPVLLLADSIRHEGEGKHSIYAEHLGIDLNHPNLKMGEALLRRVRVDGNRNFNFFSGEPGGPCLLMLPTAPYWLEKETPARTDWEVVSQIL